MTYLGLDATLVGRQPDLQEPCGVGGVVVHLRVHDAAASAEVLHAAPPQGLLLGITQPVQCAAEDAGLTTKREPVDEALTGKSTSSTCTGLLRQEQPVLRPHCSVVVHQ